MGKKGQRLKAKRRRLRTAREENKEHPGHAKQGTTWGFDYLDIPDRTGYIDEQVARLLHQHD